MIKIRGQQAWRRDYSAMKFDLLTFLVEYKSSVVNRGAAHGHRPVANTLISIREVFVAGAPAEPLRRSRPVRTISF